MEKNRVAPDTDERKVEQKIEQNQRKKAMNDEEWIEVPVCNAGDYYYFVSCMCGRMLAVGGMVMGSFFFLFF